MAGQDCVEINTLLKWSGPRSVALRRVREDWDKISADRVIEGALWLSHNRSVLANMPPREGRWPRDWGTGAAVRTVADIFSLR